MFENLTNKFEEIFSSLKKAPSLDEKQVDEGLRNIRQALLEADVSLAVAKEFINKVKPKALGQEIIRSTSPGQMVVKIVYDELVNLLRESNSEINLIQENGGVRIDQLQSIKDPLPNENFILRNGEKSILVTFDPFQEKAVQINTQTAYGIIPRNAEQSFALNVLMNDKIQLVTLTGKAGTGKTLLALASALEKNKSFQQIFLARPIVPLSNRDLGFLPGDIDSKLTPYMQPLLDNLTVIKHQFKKNDERIDKIKELLDDQKLLITPLAYIRGRSLQKSFFIVDEAQNLTPHEVKTIITRAGEGTKIVFTGDINQIDHPYLDKKSNGVSYLISRMKKQKIYSHINLKKGERSELAELASDLL